MCGLFGHQSMHLDMQCLSAVQVAGHQVQSGYDLWVWTTSRCPFLQDRDTQKIQWINRFVEELKSDKWVLPALKQIREICQLFPEVLCLLIACLWVQMC